MGLLHACLWVCFGCCVCWIWLGFLVFGGFRALLLFMLGFLILFFAVGL